jgi:hypothetical protein
MAGASGNSFEKVNLLSQAQTQPKYPAMWGICRQLKANALDSGNRRACSDLTEVSMKNNSSKHFSGHENAKTA